MQTVHKKTSSPLLPSHASDSKVLATPTATEVQSQSHASLDVLVGSVEEDREAHLRRHGTSRKDCPRCVFYTKGGRWIETYGTGEDPLTGETHVWLAE